MHSRMLAVAAIVLIVQATGGLRAGSKSAAGLPALMPLRLPAFDVSAAFHD
jgi:hypothetical protein